MTVRSFGVEEEFLLVGSDTFAPVPAAPALLRAGRVRDGVVLEAELKAEQIEAVGAPQTTHSDLLDGIVAGRHAADDAALSVGARAVATATSPAAFEAHLADDDRYRRILDRFGVIAREQFTCGQHVHVSVESPEEGIAVLDRIRGWLPAILALSTNSPLVSGSDTGFQSYRYQAWGRWPTAGPADIWGDLDRHRRVIGSLVSSGVLLDEGMVYFDARLSRNHPTVEIRIADVPLYAEDAALIAVLIRALVETAARQARRGVAPLPVATPVIAASSWLASKHGVTAGLIDPTDGSAVAASALLAKLLAHVEEALADSDDRAIAADGVERVLRRGTGAQRQRSVWQRTGDVGAVIADAAELTRGGVGRLRSS